MFKGVDTKKVYKLNIVAFNWGFNGMLLFIHLFGRGSNRVVQDTALASNLLI